MADDRPQFWIDIGGTFTDVLVQAVSGPVRRCKVLSSGVTKGTAGAGSTAAQVVDAARQGVPANFWQGYRFRLLDDRGAPQCDARVARFDASAGAFVFDPPLAQPPRLGQAYELVGPEEAPLLAIRLLLRLPLRAPIPPVVVRLGTTRGTNALLTRGGARVAYLTTRGFGDLLRIGYQNRPRLFELNIRQPVPLFETVVELDERVAADGKILKRLEEDEVRAALKSLRAAGVESLAICLLHATTEPAHERLVAALARDLGFAEIRASHQVAPLIKMVVRGETTVLDAYLNPVLKDYLAALQAALPGSDLRLMTSSGGLVSTAQFSGKDSILSGPAGGVVGFAHVARQAGFEQAIGFDMGGTSTDVARFDGHFEMDYESEKAGVRVVAPMLAIETVAAGGGSICRFDGVKLIVGPDSAGAEPGPACYGRGGPLCVTDCNFFLERISADFFPFPLRLEPVLVELQRIAAEIQSHSGQALSVAALAAGFIQIANANMAQAIRSISIAKGYDPRAAVLVPFGGAAGQHACAVAQALGMTQILLHPDAGVLSALGMGQARLTRHRSAGLYQPYDERLGSELGSRFARLAAEACAELIEEGVPAERIGVRRALEMRYLGVEASLIIDEPANGDYPAAFAAAHLRQYGYVQPGRAVEVVALRVEACEREATAAEKSHRVARRISPPVPRAPRGAAAGQPYFTRADFAPGDRLAGPALVVESTSTTVIDRGWSAEVLSGGELLLTADGASPTGPLEPAHLPPADRQNGPHDVAESATAADPIRLELFNNEFTAIADQMGLTLRNTAGSVNVKERLDFSCALFTPRGELIAGAQHIPVHLGAMSETVRQLVNDRPHIRPGDVFLTNDPFRGGSHLPDLTVVSPVHDRAGALLFFTASRAHHAEIGGITPGSMPPGSRSLAEEGVLIRDFLLIDAGQERFAALEALLCSGLYPSRNVRENLADLRAQIAANQAGSQRLQALIQTHSLRVVQAYMGHIQRAAEQKLRAALARGPGGTRTFVDHLDDGSPICVKISLDAAGAQSARWPLAFDFSGSGPVLANNLNANRAIVSAAVLYVLRCLIGEDLPLNEGLLAPVRIILPEGLLNPPAESAPERCAAMAGGNVETSQRLVDVLLGAFQLAAASQGTMNNLLFGDDTFGYYETIGGGAGATPHQAGADAVQTHMTNTRLTDPEVLERRYPVRLREFAIRRGSGGKGRWRGGDGIRREIEFLCPLEVSILSQRRGPFAPYGLAGGESGQLGRNTLRRATGEVECLPHQVQIHVQPNDRLLIETPGGGGWGPPPEHGKEKT
ncbi:MAG TPA: hydantoinase B/oxoprolinase family protein [Pirellulales bacterium]|jgi:5-oxoprolinase (ATP-hydrolysing)|nr:hydantoinase B/oxoprolinase family protein [Pirellulales bacterium]